MFCYCIFRLFYYALIFNTLFYTFFLTDILTVSIDSMRRIAEP